MPQYVVDTSLFIQAQRQYYARDIAPGFWSKLVELQKSGILISVDKVLEEINGYYDPTDPLGDWAGNICPAEMFDATANPQIAAYYSTLVDWIENNPLYRPAALAEFAKGADGWVIAYALENDCTVVSMEVSAPLSEKSAKIPDICGAFKVDHIDTFDLMRAEGISLV